MKENLHHHSPTLIKTGYLLTDEQWSISEKLGAIADSIWLGTFRLSVTDVGAIADPIADPIRLRTFHKELGAIAER